MSGLKLTILDGIYSIHRFALTAAIPAEVYSCDFYTISKTKDELSIVCPQNLKIQSDKSDSNWVCMKVIGPLDFSLTGILADISNVLANVGISIFAIPTYDTDYIMVKSDKIKDAKKALEATGYKFQYS